MCRKSVRKFGSNCSQNIKTESLAQFEHCKTWIRTLTSCSLTRQKWDDTSKALPVPGKGMLATFPREEKKTSPEESGYCGLLRCLLHLQNTRNGRGQEVGRMHQVLEMVSHKQMSEHFSRILRRWMGLPWLFILATFLYHALYFYPCIHYLTFHPFLYHALFLSMHLYVCHLYLIHALALLFLHHHSLLLPCRKAEICLHTAT